MSSAALRCRMNFQHNKSSTSTKKSSLASIWDISSSSPLSSPYASPTKEKKNINTDTVDIVSLLTGKHLKTPKKTLYCPPVIEKKEKLKPKPQDFEFMFSNITYSSKCVFNLPDSIKKYTTYVFKGGENQEIAWESFKKVCVNAKYGFIVCGNIKLYIDSGNVISKALTISANDKLESISSNLPNVELNKALDLISNLERSEKIFLYCSSPFSFSVVTPLIIKHSEMGSNSGIVYRVSLTGYMFEDCNNIISKEMSSNIHVFKTVV